MVALHEVSTHAGWIFDDNLEPWLALVATGVEYEFGSDEMEAIARAARMHDSDASQWFECSLHGAATLQLWLGRDSGTSVVQVRVEGPAPAVERAAVLTEVASCYRLTR